MTSKAVIKNGELLLPHPVGCGAELITPDDPSHDELHANAVHDEDLNGTREQDAALADRWFQTWALDRPAQCLRPSWAIRGCRFSSGMSHNSPFAVAQVERECMSSTTRGGWPVDLGG
ncbi:hypothetical protein [Actinomadura oligospora]|uniref:hypothetical protein n=1 Tax=Actinomadura oligospora TaxID=111804 RepID=UPI0012F8F90E|nr:hypothetical protein [Actinomadura oligospora]